MKIEKTVIAVLGWLRAAQAWWREAIATVSQMARDKAVLLLLALIFISTAQLICLAGALR